MTDEELEAPADAIADVLTARHITPLEAVEIFCHFIRSIAVMTELLLNEQGLETTMRSNLHGNA